MLYANVTLTSLNGDLSVVVYVPPGVTDDDVINRDLPTFYYGSRFELGSMIGSITRKRQQVDGETGKSYTKTHVLYGTDTWRMPHNTNWPESGVGLASEFGVGDDGNLCYFRCGWPQAMNVTNGVLGYQEAVSGAPFLKIGVGELIKDSCPECDSTDIYKFNSPYLFSRQPRWTMPFIQKNSNNQVQGLQLQHEARLKDYGYHLTKDISLQDNVLSMTTTLQNLGRDPFSTVWYSHHLFSCDGRAVGPGYSVDLNLNGNSMHPVYTEPGTWSWSTPLDQYGTVTSYDRSVHVQMLSDLDPGTRIKAEFEDDHATAGGFTLTACHSSIDASIESPYFHPNENNAGSQIIMYDYNLYVERGTFSPEPQILIRDLQPGQSVQWTLKLVIRDDDVDLLSSSATPTQQQQQLLQSSSWWTHLRENGMDNFWRQSFWLSTPEDSRRENDNVTLFMGFAATCTFVFVIAALLQSSWRRQRRRRGYDDIQ